MNLSFSTSIESKCSIIRLCGNILSDADADTLAEHIDTMTNWQIIFDLSDLNHINSSGISTFVKTMTKCRINQGDLLISNPNKNIFQLFEITKMNEVFSIHDSNESALNQFN
tara:strand:+ start:1317 stop:1652 length:336 start_codon:yes stop_codon:yes gene_type:complete